MSVVFGAQSQTLATISFGKSSRQDVVIEFMTDERNSRILFKGEQVINHRCWRIWEGLKGSTGRQSFPASKRGKERTQKIDTDMLMPNNIKILYKHWTYHVRACRKAQLFPGQSYVQ